MTLKQFIAETIWQRSRFIILGLKPYSQSNSAPKTKDAKRLNAITRHYKKKDWAEKIDKLAQLVRVRNNESELTYRPNYLAQKCQHSGRLYGETRMVVVAMNGNVEWWGADSLSANAFYCEYTQVFYRNSVFHQSLLLTNRGRVRMNVCREAVANLFFQWEDGTLRDTNPTNGGLGSAMDIQGVGQYHGQPRPWNEKGFKDLKVFGIELETLAPSQRVRTAFANRARQLGILAERDGSLAEEGLEFIAKPMTYEEVEAKGGPWETLVKEAREAGFLAWNALAPDRQTGERAVQARYGMHINLNRHHFAPLHMGKFIAFINNQVKLSTQVAGREPNRYSIIAPKQVDFVPDSTDKYQAVALRGRDRAEVRIFRATVNWEGFMRNVEFVDSVIEFTRKCDIKKMEAEDFIKWLEGQKGYERLKSFLKRKKQELYKNEI